MTAPGVYWPATPATLAARTAEAIGRNPDRRTGTVVSFSAGILTVSVGGGDPEQVGYLGSYLNPTPGDVVALVLQRSTWLCLGRIFGEGQLPPANNVVTQAGQVTANVNGTSLTVGVVFAQPFVPGSGVSIVCNINSGAGTTASWHVRAINVATTGFTVFLFGPNATFSASVGWIAVVHGIQHQMGGPL